MSQRKFLFYAFFLTFVLSLYSVVACHHGHSGSFTEGVLTPSDPGTPDNPGDPDNEGPDRPCDVSSADCPVHDEVGDGSDETGEVGDERADCPSETCTP